MSAPKLKSPLHRFPMVRPLVNADDARLRAADVIKGGFHNAGVYTEIFHPGRACAAKIMNAPRLELGTKDFLHPRIKRPLGL